MKDGGPHHARDVQVCRDTVALGNMWSIKIHDVWICLTMSSRWAWGDSVSHLTISCMHGVGASPPMAQPTFGGCALPLLCGITQQALSLTVSHTSHMVGRCLWSACMGRRFLPSLGSRPLPSPCSWVGAASGPHASSSGSASAVMQADGGSVRACMGAAAHQWRVMRAGGGSEQACNGEAAHE